MFGKCERKGDRKREKATIKENNAQKLSWYFAATAATTRENDDVGMRQMFLTSLSVRESIDRDIVTIMLSIIMKISFNDFAVSTIIASCVTHSNLMHLILCIMPFLTWQYIIFPTTYSRNRISLSFSWEKLFLFSLCNTRISPLKLYYELIRERR